MPNFFDPNIILKNDPLHRTYKQFRYEQIWNKQAQLAYAYKGGVTIADMDSMSEFDLDILMDTMLEIREAEAEAQRKAANPNMRFASKPRKSRFSLD